MQGCQTWRRTGGIVAKPWKILRWAASAYAHDQREHAASWLSCTNASTQGQTNAHAQMKHWFSCVQRCIFCACASSLAAPESHVPCPLRFQTLMVSSRSRQKHPSLFSAPAAAKLLTPRCTSCEVFCISSVSPWGADMEYLLSCSVSDFQLVWLHYAFWPVG